MKKFFTLLSLLCAINSFAQVTIYSENMGTTTTTTLINAYTGWQNASPIVYSSSTTPAQSDVRSSAASTGYTGASGITNVFMGTTVGNARDFIISGINTSAYTNVQLAFGLNTNSTTLFLTLEYSTDGTNFTPVSFTNPTATGWSLISGLSLPAAANLTLKFSKNNTAQFRIDDVLITGNGAGIAALTAGPAVTGLTAITPSASTTGSYNLAGTTLTGFPGNITVTPSANLEVSLSSGSGFTAGPLLVPYTSATLTSTPIYTRIAAGTAVGPFTGSVSNSGGGATTVTVNVSGNVLDPEPTVQATNVSFSAIGNNGFTANWTNGNGATRIVVVRQTTVTAVNPVDGTTYSVPGSTGTGNSVVYSGTGNSVVVTGLLAGTNYTVKVYEANGTNYLLADAAANPNAVSTTGVSPVLTQINFTGVSVPQYMAFGESGSPAVATRVPVLFYATVSNLTPNTTYRYYTQGSSAATDFGLSQTGAGNSLLFDYTASPVTYTYSSSLSVTTAGGYGKFTTNASGSFTGAFAIVPTNNTRFAAGNALYPSIALALDITTPTILNRFALDQAITPLVFATTSGPNDGTFIKGTSSATPGNVVALWKSVDGNLVATRPLAMTLAENPTITGSAWAVSFVPGYDQSAGSWNTIIPNDNPEGVRLIQQFNLSTGQPVGCNSDADGVWPSGANTGDPTNGYLTPIQITSGDAPLNAGACFGILPVSLVNFTATKTNRTVNLKWTTAQELNSRNFVIERSTDNRTWTSIATVAAAGFSNTARNYVYVDNSPAKGINYYRLKQVDIDYRSVTSAVRPVLFSEQYAITVAPNPATDFINVYIAKNDQKTTQVIVADINGKVIEKRNTGDQLLQISTSRFAKGVYFVKVITDEQTTTQKVIVQ